MVKTKTNVVSLFALLIVACSTSSRHSNKTTHTTKKQSKIRYIIANLGPVDKLDFFVPDTRNQNFNCKRHMSIIEACKSSSSIWLKEKKKNKKINYFSISTDKIFEDNAIKSNQHKITQITDTDGEKAKTLRKSCQYDNFISDKGTVLEKLNNDCLKKNNNCNQIDIIKFIKKFNPTTNRRSILPLLQLEEIRENYPDLEIIINTSISSIFGITDWYSMMPCVQIASQIKTSSGQIIGNSLPHLPLDTLYFVKRKNTPLEFVRYSDHINNKKYMKISEAFVQGITLIRDGHFAENHRIFKPDEQLYPLKKAYRCFAKNGRTILGINKSKELLITYVLNREKNYYGAKCKEISQILIDDHQVQNAIFFDGGGSSQVFISQYNKTIFNSLDMTIKRRPLGHFLGIKISPDHQIRLHGNLPHKGQK